MRMTLFALIALAGLALVGADCLAGSTRSGSISSTASRSRSNSLRSTRSAPGRMQSAPKKPGFLARIKRLVRPRVERREDLERRESRTASASGRRDSMSSVSSLGKRSNLIASTASNKSATSTQPGRLNAAASRFRSVASRVIGMNRPKQESAMEKIVNQAKYEIKTPMRLPSFSN